MKELDEIKEKYGVVVELPTVSGISPYIKSNGRLKLASIAYSHKRGFYVNASGTWLSAEETREYTKSLLDAADIVDTLNRIYQDK